MNTLSVKLLWTGLIVALCAGLLWQFYPLSDASLRLKNLPLRGIWFTGEEIPLSEFENTYFKDVGVVKRVYKIGGRPYFITILDGTRNRHMVHDPYYCLKGSGWTALYDKNIPVIGGHASLVDLEKNGNTKEALYWFSDGTINYTSPFHYWWDTTLRRVSLGTSGPEPILIMIQPLSKESINVDDLQEKFPEIFNL